jgi:hypothetical protein
MRNKIIHEMKSEVVSMIIKEARKQRLHVFSHSSELVSSIRDITEVWVKSSDIDNHKKIWMSYFGQFDIPNDFWDWELEEKFMKRCNYRYRDNTHGVEGEYHVQRKSEKGCIAKVIRSIKNSLVKNLNAASKRVGKRLTIERSAEDVLKQPNFRRKPGKFYEWNVRWLRKNMSQSSPSGKSDGSTGSYLSVPENSETQSGRSSSSSKSSSSSSSRRSTSLSLLSSSSSTSSESVSKREVSRIVNTPNGPSSTSSDSSSTTHSSRRGSQQHKSNDKSWISPKRYTRGNKTTIGSSPSSSEREDSKKHKLQHSKEWDNSPYSMISPEHHMIRNKTTGRSSSSSNDESSKQKIERLEAEVKALNNDKNDLIKNNSGKQGIADRNTINTLKSQLLKGSSGTVKKKVAVNKSNSGKKGGRTTKETGKRTEEPEYHVERLIDIRVRNKKEEVLVYWTTEEESWEPASEIAKTHQEEIEELKSALAEKREKSREEKEGKVSLFYLHAFQ